jgi:hypothetical protein
MAPPRRKWSKPELEKLAEFLFDGFNISDIAFYFDCSRELIRKIRDGEAIPEIRKAVIDRKAFYIAEIRDSENKRFARIAWFLERRWPKEFARPEVQLSLSEQHTTNNTLVVSAEVAEALLKRSKAINTEIDALLEAKRPDMSSSTTHPGGAGEPEQSEGECA